MRIPDHIWPSQPSMNAPLKVLVISQAFPYPPHDGNLLPIYHFLRCLAPRVRFTLLTLRPDGPDAEKRWEEGRRLFEQWGIDVRAVTAHPKARLGQAWQCLRHGRLWVNRFFVPELAEAAKRALNDESWDIVQAEGILSAQHLPQRINAGSVLIARDCLSRAHRENWRRTRAPKELAQWGKIRWMEADLYRRFDRILAISPTDRAEMERIAPGSVVDLLPNGVDLELFKPAPELEEPGLVAFSGAMDFAPNVDAVLFFCREVWPLVMRKMPEARFIIVGRDPTATVGQLAREASVTVTGRVECIQNVLARAAVIVSPLRQGTGMKNKVLEGAAMGKAMVVSPVSLEDINLEPGRDLILAHSAGETADRIVKLLADPAERQRLGRSAREAVEREYAWEAMAERLWACYQQCFSKNSKR